MLFTERLSKLHAYLYLLLETHQGFIPFDVFMNAVLYTPALGYYTATRPVGTNVYNSDFITAPEISTLFGLSIANAIYPCFKDNLPINIMECGAGTGKLALDILTGLEHLGVKVNRYFILELSPTLRYQQETLLSQFKCVEWLDKLPDDNAFEGIIVANELLDALPVKACVIKHGVLLERGITWNEAEQSWVWISHIVNMQLKNELNAIKEIKALLNTNINININETINHNESDYEFEYGQQTHAWVATAGRCLKRGAMLLIDYGFTRNELYHPQRRGGTLMAHHRHRAMTDVLAHLGDADITAHVDFTAVLNAGIDAGLTPIGYVNQANFLINAGISDLFMKHRLSENDDNDNNDGSNTINHSVIQHNARLSQGLNLLLSEAEMGELFKVIAFVKNCQEPIGFQRSNRLECLEEMGKQ